MTQNKYIADVLASKPFARILLAGSAAFFGLAVVEFAFSLVH